MRQFTLLCEQLESANSVRQKRAVFIKYLSAASDADKVWTLAMLSGKRPKRIAKTTDLRLWVEEVADIPSWLFQASYEHVGDLSETIAKVLPQKQFSDTEEERSLSEWMNLISHNRSVAPDKLQSFIATSWRELSTDERVVFNKIVTGGFRVVLAQKVIQESLAVVVNQEESLIAHKLTRDWRPDEITFYDLILKEDVQGALSRPFPFQRVRLLEEEPEFLGKASEWSATHEWGGLRVQLVLRQGELFVWTESGELVTSHYPEFHTLNESVEDMVIEGELVVFEERVGSFLDLQKRVGKQKPSKKISTDLPVVLVVNDLYEYKGEDLRNSSFSLRNEILRDAIEKAQSPVLLISELLEITTWEAMKALRVQARTKGATAIRLRANAATNSVAEAKPSWYTWKTEPYRVTAVLLYVTRAGRSSSQFSEFTFALRQEGGNNNNYITFTKIREGFSEQELKEISKFVKKNKVERFGPVVSIRPELVFDISFDRIAASARHKCGFVILKPKILSWERDKTVEEINTVQEILQYIIK